MLPHEARDLAPMYRDGRYAGLHPEWHGDRAAWKSAHVLRAMRELDLAPATICDIGCGTGQVLDHVVAATPGVERAVGFELSPDVPQAVLGSDRVEIRSEDATLTDDRFDLALMLDVFEHVEDYIGFLRSCSRLAPTMILHIPLEITLVNVALDRLGASRFNLGHLHQFTARTAIESLEYSGLRPVHRFLTPAAWTGPGRQPRAPINRLRRLGVRISERWAQRALGGMSMLVVAETGR